MKRNFDFLKDINGFGQVYNLCRQVEEFQSIDPMRSAQCGRLALETMARIVYYLKSWTIEKEKPTLFDMVTDERFVSFIGSDDMMKRIHYIRKVGNNAMHVSDHTITRRESFFLTLNLYYFVGDVMLAWQLIDELPPFDKALILNKQEEIASDFGIVTTDTSLLTTLSTKTASEVVATSKPTAQPKNIKHKKPTELSEVETRRLYIDLLLNEAGWDVLEKENLIVPGKACIEIEVDGMPTPTGKGYSDYVLFADNGLPLAVVEAKKCSVDPTVGRKQAELYADCLMKKYGCPRPVIYFTNGFEIHIIDGLGYPPRAVLGFHSQKELAWMMTQRGRNDITDLSINDNITNRKYQKRAIESVCKHFNDKYRRALLVMATGTGKTRVSVSLVDVLVRNGWVKNVLFLADRTELVNQAKKNYDKLLPAQTTGLLMDKGNCDKLARILFSTYQTMIGYVNTDTKEFGIGRFDLIIIDEAHRSVFGKLGAMLSYFDALQLGLTATPRDEVDRSTYDLFGMEQGVPTDSYEYQEALDDGFLVPYKLLNRKSKIISEGIKTENLSEEQRKELQAIFEYEKAQHLLEGDSRDIAATEIFKYIYNINTIDQVLTDLMQNGLKVNDGGMIGKTIIFAYNHKHAQLVVDRFNNLYPQLGADFCRVIDNYEKYADQLIIDFEVATGMPQIAVSVDMLDTGIDVPEVLNLVFFKPVHSKIKFWQMIGRGTRLCPNLFGQDKDKAEFYIFDYWGNFDYFKVHGDVVKPTNSKSIVASLFCLRTDIKCALQAAEYQGNPSTKVFHDELSSILCKQTASLNRSRIEVRQNLSLVEKFSVLESWTYVSMLDAQELKDKISLLFVQKVTDIAALRFDALLLKIQLATVDSTVKVTYCQKSVIEIARALSEKASIPQVEAKMDIIRRAMTEEFWEEHSLDSLEEVRVELRELVKYLMEESIKTSFVVDIDDIISEETVEGSIPEIRTYRQRVIDFLKEHHSDEPAIKKIYNLEPLTRNDILRLEEIFWKELGTKDEYEEQARNIPYGNSVAAFIRSIIGIDQDKALAMYREIAHDNELTRMQEEFLRTIIRYVCQNGDIRKEILANKAPFRNFNIKHYFGEKSSLLVKYVKMLQDTIA